MRIESAWGVSLLGDDLKLLKQYDKMLHDLKNTDFKGLKLDFTELKEIVVFEDLRSFEKFDDSVLGSYERPTSKIYIYNCNLNRLPYAQKKITLLHELCHFYRDKTLLFNYLFYCENYVYRCYEELRVDVLACFLAKRILPEEIEYIDFYMGKSYDWNMGQISIVKARCFRIWLEFLVLTGRKERKPTSTFFSWNTTDSSGATVNISINPCNS